MSLKSAAAAMLAVAFSLAPGAAYADRIEVVSGTPDPNGTSQRSTTFNSGAIGQSFTAIDSVLTDFGFQFTQLNAGSPNSPFSFELRAGEGLNGTLLASSSFTLPTSINSRNPVWFDFSIAPTAVAAGQLYTAILNTPSLRYGIMLGPNYNIFTGQPLTGDAYAGGRLVSATAIYPNCTQNAASNCDLNFRVTGFTPAAAAVPEPASWALMIGGFGLAGGIIRRRRHAARAFA